MSLSPICYQLQERNYILSSRRILGCITLKVGFFENWKYKHPKEPWSFHLDLVETVNQGKPLKRAEDTC